MYVSRAISSRILSCAFCPRFAPPGRRLPVTSQRRIRKARLASSRLRKSSPTNGVKRFAFCLVSAPVFGMLWRLLRGLRCKTRTFRAEALFFMFVLRQSTRVWFSFVSWRYTYIHTKSRWLFVRATYFIPLGQSWFFYRTEFLVIFILLQLRVSQSSSVYCTVGEYMGLAPASRAWYVCVRRHWYTWRECAFLRRCRK